MKKDELLKIVKEFENSYLNTKQGREHLEVYRKERKEVRKIFNEIKERRGRGEDITDMVIHKLLPIERESATGAGVKTIKAYGWSDEDLPMVAKTVFDLIDKLISVPDDVDKQKEIITSFVSSPYQRGFQTGIITPILYCLQPKYLLINKKVVDTVRYI